MSPASLLKNRRSADESTATSPTGWGTAIGLLVLGGIAGFLYGTVPMIVGAVVGGLLGNEIEYQWMLRVQDTADDPTPETDSDDSGESVKADRSEVNPEESEEQQREPSTRSVRQKSRGLGRRGEAQSLLNLGLVTQAQGRVSEAREYYHRSMQVFQEVGDIRGEAQALNYLGDLSRHQDEVYEAEEFYERSLELIRDAGDRRGEARILNALGMLSQQRGEYEQAEEYYKQSLEIYNEIGDHGSEAEVLGALGYTAQIQDALGEAKQYYQRSLDLVNGEIEDGLYFLGASTLIEGRIRIPEDVLDIGIFDSGDKVYWSFVETNGMRIISNGHLEQNRVSFLGSQKLDESNRVSVPHPIVANDKREPPEQSNVPEYAKMSEGETYHFIATEDMIESDPKMCYLMTSHELGEMITKAPDWDTIHTPIGSSK